VTRVGAYLFLGDLQSILANIAMATTRKLIFCGLIFAMMICISYSAPQEDAVQERCKVSLLDSPVCGSDGKTYSNPMELGCENKNLVKEGKPEITQVYEGECKKE